MRIFFLSLLFFSTLLEASPVGNGAFPRILTEGIFIPKECWANLRLGYEGDFVSDGRMKQTQQSSGRVDTFSQTTNGGTVTLNLLHRLDLYGVLGGSKASARWRFTDANDVVSSAKLETYSSFLWAVGGRSILCEWGKFDLGLGGRYSWAHYQPAWLTIDGSDIGIENGHCHWNEWQINLDISYQISLLTPYLGAKYEKSRMNLGGFSSPIGSGGQGANCFQQRNPWGMYVGCTLSTGAYLMLNIEGRLFDEEALSVSADLRF